jgi:hypothetical protein
VADGLVPSGRGRALFEWSDAWVFAALSGAADAAGQVDFSRLVAVADMLNHAIVTADEVRRALDKLHAAGLVEVMEGRVTVTPLATRLRRKLAGARGGAFTVVDSALGMLNSPRTSLPLVETMPDTAFITEDLMQEAHRRYVQAIGRDALASRAPNAGSEDARAVAARERDRASALARSDTPAALGAARDIRDPWYCAQALAWVARYAPDGDVEAIAAESLRWSRRCPDAYQRVAAAAWPLRALVERGSLALARARLAPLLDEERDVEPPSSRSEALLLLFEACFDLGSDSREALARRLAAVHDASGHWRSRRNLREALSMLAAVEPQLASAVTASVTDERVLGRAATPGRTPRPFFW